MDPSNIAALCKAYRQCNQLTQTQLASICGVSAPTICKAEHGQPVSVLARGKILKIVGGADHD